MMSLLHEEYVVLDSDSDDDEELYLFDDDNTKENYHVLA